jgi:hypothetical protein
MLQMYLSFLEHKPTLNPNPRIRQFTVASKITTGGEDENFPPETGRLISLMLRVAR